MLNQTNIVIDLWPWKHIWKVRIPYKVAYFVWLVARKACLTQDNLRRRGISLCSRCHLCGREEETNSHLFLHCSVTVQVWNIFIALTGIQWVMPDSTIEMLSCWNKGRRSVSEKKRWGMIPASIWWTLWNKRNSRCFEDNTNSIQKIKMNCLLLFHFWCKLEYIADSEAIIDVLGSL